VLILILGAAEREARQRRLPLARLGAISDATWALCLLLAHSGPSCGLGSRPDDRDY